LPLLRADTVLIQSPCCLVFNAIGHCTKYVWRIALQVNMRKRDWLPLAYPDQYVRSSGRFCPVPTPSSVRLSQRNAAAHPRHGAPPPSSARSPTTAAIPAIARPSAGRCQAVRQAPPRNIRPAPSTVPPSTPHRTPSARDRENLRGARGGLRR